MKKNFLIVMMLMLIWNISAQNMTITEESELLIYRKFVNNQEIYVIQRDNQTITYPLQSDECGDISNDGRYIALSSEQPANLRIVHIQSMKVVFETAWQPIWRPCNIGWRWTYKDILVLTNNDFTTSYEFRFENLTLNPDVIYPEPIYPTLPYFTPVFEPTGVEMFYLQNPAYPNIYFYQKCYAEKLLGEECNSDGMVIYDLITNTELETIIDGSSLHIRGFRVDMRGTRRVVSENLGSWSPNGRYLAYFDDLTSGNAIPDEGRIVVYDLQEDSYIEDNDGFYLPNINQEIQWANGNILLVWKTDIFTQVAGYYYHDSSSKFVFAHLDTGNFVYADGLFDVWSRQAFFAPDGRAMTIVAKELDPYEGAIFGENPRRADLILISTTTGEHTVIDTDVTEIITWRSICDFTVSYTASLISTMQSEPYSVICLDENGQYDLTASLPDVFGDITLIGNGSQIVMTGGSRIFNVTATGGLHLKNVTLSGGVADEGGAIYNAGELTLENAILQNHSAVRGGAIYNTGNLIMNGGAIQNNTATESGGGIYNIGNMQLDGVNIRDNSASEGSGVYQGG